MATQIKILVGAFGSCAVVTNQLSSMSGNFSKVHVLLVFANPVLHPLAQPYGLNIIRGVLRENGVEAKLILPYQATEPRLRLQKALNELNPCIIGFSFRNLDPAGYAATEEPYTFLSSLRSLVDICEDIRPNALRVIGGSGFSSDPRLVFRNVDVALGFLGPAEHDFSVFVKRYLEADEAARSRLTDLISGIPSAVLNQGKYSFQRQDRCIAPRNFLPKDLQPQASIHSEQAIDLAKVHGATIPIRTKTGCSLRCSYCVVPFIERLNYRNVNEVLDELEEVKSLGLGDQIFLADGEFNLPSEERALEICRAIYDRFGDGLAWRCYVCPTQQTSRLAEAMRLSGCVSVGVTVDSFSDRLRGLMNKRCSAEEARHAVKVTIAAGIETNITLLFGSPGEGPDTISETCTVTRSLLREGAHASITVGLRVYPGTPLWRQSQQEEFERHVYYLGPEKVPIFSSPWERRRLKEVLDKELPPGPCVHWTFPVGSGIWRDYVKLAEIHDLLWLGKTHEALQALKEYDFAEASSANRELLRAKILKRQGYLTAAISVLQAAQTDARKRRGEHDQS